MGPIVLREQGDHAQKKQKVAGFDPLFFEKDSLLT